MKKLFTIIILCLFYNQTLLGSEILDSSDKHINLALAKGTKKKIVLSRDRIYYAKDYCRKYKKNTYAFEVDYNNTWSGILKVRFICAKNKEEAVENMKWAIKNLDYDTVYTVRLRGRSPSLSDIDSAFEEKNKPKTVAKKPENNSPDFKVIGFDVKFCKPKTKAQLRQGNLAFPVFEAQDCNKYGGVSSEANDYFYVSYESFWTYFHNQYGRKPEICFDLNKKILKGALSCSSNEVKFKYNKNDEKIYASIDKNELATIKSVAEPKTVIVEKPKEKKPIQKKPEKKIIKSVEVDSSLITIGSGSGFYINNKGYALTNNHVIDICKQSIAVIDGKETLFRVIATDKTNDVAVLKTDLRSRNYIRINEDGAKLGENVIAVGYPLAGRLSDSVKITRGIVSSTSGLNNNIGQIQIDAALQPGNSGGPVLNENGELVGIASAGLNKLLMAKEAKYIPENVNFAVASPIVVNILKSKKIKYSTPSMFSGSYSNTELAELGNSSTIQLFCRNTRTAYNRLKSSNKYSTVLLDLD